MQRVVAPSFQAYEKLPSGPQISTVSPGHTLVSGALIEQFGRGFSTIVTEHVLSLAQPVARSVITREYVPAPTVMQRVVAPLLQAYEKLPSGPQISTVSPAHTSVSGALVGQFGRGPGVTVTEHVLSLAQPVARSVITREYVPAPTLMQRVVAPLLQAYEKLPSGPQISTVSVPQTSVSGALIEQTGRGLSTIVTEQSLLLTQPPARSVITRE